MKSSDYKTEGRLYSASTNGTINCATVGTASVLYLWHSASNPAQIEIQKITTTLGFFTSTSFMTHYGGFITSEADPASGSITTANVLDRAEPASSLTGTLGAVRVGALKGLPTRVGGQLYAAHQTTTPGATPQQTKQNVLFDVQSSGSPLVLRPNVSEGFEVFVTIKAGSILQPAQVSATIYWLEFD